jgi:hypothetical protein
MKCTRFAVTRDGAGAAATASIYTSPVNQSAGPLAVSIELRVICMVLLLSVMSSGDGAVRWAVTPQNAL